MVVTPLAAASPETCGRAMSRTWPRRRCASIAPGRITSRVASGVSATLAAGRGEKMAAIHLSNARVGSDAIGAGQHRRAGLVSAVRRPCSSGLQAAELGQRGLGIGHLGVFRVHVEEVHRMRCSAAVVDSVMRHEDAPVIGEAIHYRAAHAA
jgi:hypothetical protein